MRKLLLSLASAMLLLGTTTASAITFKEKYPLDKDLNLRNELVSNPLTTVHRQAPLTDGELVTHPQGEKSRYAMAVNIFLSNMGATHIGGFGADVYISEEEHTFSSRAFTLNYFQQGYSVGEIQGDSVVFTSGQYIYNTYDSEKAYMYAAYLAEDESWPDLVDTFVLKKDEKGYYRSEPGYYFIVLTEEEAEGGINEDTDIICFGTDYVFTPLPADIAEDVMPEDAEMFECQFIGNSLNAGGEAIMSDITVGVSGDKIYVGGLCDYLPGCSLVGVKTGDDTYTFNSHQYLGYYDEGDFPYIYEYTMVNPLYFDGDGLYYNAVESVTMTLNKEHTILTLEEDAGIFNCAYGDINSWNEVYWGVLIGDLNGNATPQVPGEVSYYGNYGSPYINFVWENMSVEGLPMNANNLWCELIVNGETYEFTPEYYEGLTEPTTRIYYNTSGIGSMYIGQYTTIYFPEYEDNEDAIKTIGVKIGYQSGEETNYTETVYASGYEPIEDKAFVPSVPTELVYYKDYYTNLRFSFDGKDVEGNDIPARLLGVEIFLDGEPLVFKDSDYYFNGGDGEDVTVIGLTEHSLNYNSSLVSGYDGEYIISLWAHHDLPEFKTVAVRAVCTGGDTFTYGESCEIKLERAATPANPWNVTYDESSRKLVFGSLPVDKDGNGLAPWNYGYEVYVNGELYKFNGKLYETDNDVTLIPYGGFEHNYNFYLYTDYVYDETTWTLINKVVVMEVKMLEEDLDIKKLGVRAVYTDADGMTTYSDIVNTDGTIDTPSAVNAMSVGSDETRWYNLQGVEVANPTPGSIYLRQQGGKTTKVMVK